MIAPPFKPTDETKNHVLVHLRPDFAVILGQP
jgi:hypothetical protein